MAVWQPSPGDQCHGCRRYNCVDPQPDRWPADPYTVDGEEVYLWQAENDDAFALISALDADQQTQAILGDSYINLVLGPGGTARRSTRRSPGLQHDCRQQQLLLDLIRVRGYLEEDDANAKMAEIEANLAETWFAWYGSTTNGDAAYYRIQGPTVFIEYSPSRWVVQRLITSTPCSVTQRMIMAWG
ncbi:MAG: DUF3500 domain-containing protein [Caldilineaceae bacterium]